MKNEMLFEDSIGKLTGYYLAEVYEGDIKRKKIPISQRLWNLYADIRWKYFKIPSSHYYRGDVLNKKVHSFSGNNLVTNSGKGIIMDRLYGLSAVAAMSRLGVGTSATAAAVGDTALTGGVFVAFDATPIRTSLTVTSISTYGTGVGNINWQEMGSDNGTTLLSRIAPIGPFNKTTAVSIIITYALTQS